MTLLSIQIQASDDFVIIYGDKIQPRKNQTLEVICFESKAYSVIDKEIDGVISQIIDVNPHDPWFKLAYNGGCTGLETIKSEQVVLDRNSPETVRYLKEGVSGYSERISEHKSFDHNLKAFYKEVNAPDFEPKFEAITNKWPVGEGSFLIEQCFTVSANVESFPSNKRDFVFGQKYKRAIVSEGSITVLIDTVLNLDWAYCECDGNPPPTCQIIDQVTDINGNGMYEIQDGEQQPEGMRLQLQEYNGKVLETVFEMCTGDFAYPYDTFSCPVKRVQ